MNAFNALQRWMLVLLGAVMITACANQPTSTVTYYGTIENITLTRAGSTDPINVGSVLGGIAGAVIGYQFGGGVGKGLLTAAGAVGGAMLGNEVQKSQDRDRYQITVRLEGGGTLVVSEVDEGQLRVGDRVRVVEHGVHRA